MLPHERLLQIFSCLDLTSLEATDNQDSITKLIQKANHAVHGHKVAAICVFPVYADFARSTLASDVRIAVVGGFFPSGQTFTQAKITEVIHINQSVAQEVDVVINRGAFLSGNFSFVKDEISQLRACIPDKILKVILETGELQTAQQIEQAAKIAISAGADFIKTSTGKIQTGATHDAVETMCYVIKEHYQKTGIRIGIKPSGGVRTVKQAAQYVQLVEGILGTEWIQPELFRVGASALYDALLDELKHASNH